MKTPKKSQRLLVCLLLLALSTACPAHGTEHWAELISQGAPLRESKPDAALVLYKQALAEAEHFAPDDPRLTSTLGLLGDLLIKHMNRPAEGITYLKRQQQILDTLGDDFCGKIDGEILLSDAYLRQGNYELCEKYLLHAMKIKPAGYAFSNKDYFIDINNLLGQCYTRWKKFDKAESCFRDALVACRKRYGAKEDGSDFWLTFHMGEMYAAERQSDRAISTWTRAKEIMERNPDWGDNSHSEAMCLYNIAEQYASDGKLDKALEFYDKTIAVAAGKANNRGLTISSLYGIARIDRRRKHYGAALRHATQALKIAEGYSSSSTEQMQTFIAAMKKALTGNRGE